MKNIGKLIIFVFALMVLAASGYAADDTLIGAVKSGDKAAVEALLARGADVNAKDMDGITPLHAASSYDRNEIAQLLITKFSPWVGSGYTASRKRSP